MASSNVATTGVPTTPAANGQPRNMSCWSSILISSRRRPPEAWSSGSSEEFPRSMESVLAWSYQFPTGRRRWSAFVLSASWYVTCAKDLSSAILSWWNHIPCWPFWHCRNRHPRRAIHPLGWCKWRLKPHIWGILHAQLDPILDVAPSLSCFVRGLCF